MLDAQQLSNYITRDCFGREGNGKFTCNSLILFSKIYAEIEPFYRTVPIQNFIERILKDAARIAANRYYESGALKSIEQSLNNCGGRWYELLFMDSALHHFGESSPSEPQILLYKLPSDKKIHRLHALSPQTHSKNLAV